MDIWGLLLGLRTTKFNLKVLRELNRKFELILDNTKPSDPEMLLVCQVRSIIELRGKERFLRKLRKLDLHKDHTLYEEEFKGLRRLFQELKAGFPNVTLLEILEAFLTAIGSKRNENLTSEKFRETYLLELSKTVKMTEAFLPEKFDKGEHPSEEDRKQILAWLGT